MSAPLVVVDTLEEAVTAIDQFEGSPADFRLSVPESLFGVSLLMGQLASGAGAAWLTDRALARGWFPVGFVLEGDRRIWSYSEF